jgi:hypothetical protein
MRLATEELLEGKDYYLDEQGRFVLTEAFLKKRGYCCGNKCRHCPYDHENVPNGQK